MPGNEEPEACSGAAHAPPGANAPTTGGSSGSGCMHEGGRQARTGSVSVGCGLPALLHVSEGHGHTGSRQIIASSYKMLCMKYDSGLFCFTFCFSLGLDFGLS